MTYEIVGNGQAILCHQCGRRSWHPMDVKHRYCGECKLYHDGEPHKTVETPESACPKCGTKFNRATSATGGHTPTAGDFTICLACAEILQFRDDLSVEPIPDAIIEAMESEALIELHRVQATIRLFIAKRKIKP
jgi:hypothetical protein